MNPLNSDVVLGISSPSPQLKHTDVSAGVYEQAKNTGETVAADIGEEGGEAPEAEQRSDDEGQPAGTGPKAANEVKMYTSNGRPRHIDEPRISVLV